MRLLKQTKLSATTQRYALATLTLTGLVAASGCHVDMWAQPKIKPYYESDFFADKQSSRPLVPGTVAQNGLKLDDAIYTGYVNGKLVKTIPAATVRSFDSPKAMLLRGQSRYNAYCSPCHSRVGDGNGMITQRGLGYWQKLPASYHTDRLRKIEDGHFYDVIVNGYGVMYGYSSRIQDVNDRWAVVAYIRALQLSRNAPNTEVPAEIQGQLNEMRASQAAQGNSGLQSPAGNPELGSGENGAMGRNGVSGGGGVRGTTPPNRTEGGEAPGARNGTIRGAEDAGTGTPVGGTLPGPAGRPPGSGNAPASGIGAGGASGATTGATGAGTNGGR